ncbi:MAG: hypothetical protein LH606_01435 [Cytophagaceae bacterium]|nr:hypothetical protein [Cytophagaceae bacterium]
MKDTPPHLEELQYQLAMQRSGEERFRLGLKMAEDGWKLMIAGVRARNPEATETELRKAILRHLQTFDEAYGFIELENESAIPSTDS